MISGLKNILRNGVTTEPENYVSFLENYVKQF